jgi:predicted enzyme related to lactoylglutathione lyase
MAWSLTEVDDGVIDGIPTHGATTAGPPAEHPNTTTSIAHVVVASPDLDRTTEAFGAFGLELRRTRDAGRMEQRFFRAGEVILELIGQPGAHGDGPATIWGLALTVADLDAAAAALGEHLGPITGAVQRGRRIATLRHEAVGLHVPIALLTVPPPRDPA